MRHREDRAPFGVLNRNMLAGALLFVGGSLVTMAIPISEALFPNYRVANNYISDLGGPITLAEHPPGVVIIHQPASIIFILAVLLLGVSTLLSARTIGDQSSKWFRRFLYLYGIGALIVAASYAPYYAYSNKLIPGPLTSVPIPIGVGAAAHGIGSLCVFLFGGLSAVTSFGMVKRPFSYFCLVAGVVAVLALVFAELGITIGLGIGGIERMSAYPTLAWTIAIGGYWMGMPEGRTKSTDECS